jgi:hypothetical protein
MCDPCRINLAWPCKRRGRVDAPPRFMRRLPSPLMSGQSQNGRLGRHKQAEKQAAFNRTLAVASSVFVLDNLFKLRLRRCMHAAGPRVFKPQSLDYRLHARLLPRFLQLLISIVSLGKVEALQRLKSDCDA